MTQWFYDYTVLCYCKSRISKVDDEQCPLYQILMHVEYSLSIWSFFLFTMLNNLDCHNTVVRFKINVKFGILFFFAHIKSSSSDTVPWKRKQKNHARYLMGLIVLSRVSKKKKPYHASSKHNNNITAFAIATLHWEDILATLSGVLKWNKLPQAYNTLLDIIFVDSIKEL